MITIIYLYTLYIKEINRASHSVTVSLRESPFRINGGPSLHSSLGLFLLIFFFLSLFRSMLISEIYMTNTRAASQPKMSRARWSARSTISTTATPSEHRFLSIFSACFSRQSLPIESICSLGATHTSKEFRLSAEHFDFGEQIANLWLTAATLIFKILAWKESDSFLTRKKLILIEF